MASVISETTTVADDDLMVVYQFQFDIKKENKLAVDEDWLSGTFTSMPGGDVWQLQLARSDGNIKSEFSCKLQLVSSTSEWKIVRIGVVSESEGRQISIRSATEEAIVFKVGREFTLGTFNVDIFTWQIRVEVLRHIEGLPKRTFEPPKSQLASQLLKLFQSADFGDSIVVASDGKKFHCHQDILARRSEVFRQMFSSTRNVAEKNEVNKGIDETLETQMPGKLLKIDDFDGEIVAQMLLCIYIDDCSDIGPMANRLYVAADQYKLDRLKNLCESELAGSMSKGNVVETQQLAERYDMANLEAKCVDYQAAQVKSEVPMAAGEPNAKRPRHKGPTGVSITSEILPTRIAPGSILVDDDPFGLNIAKWGDMYVGNHFSIIFTDGNEDSWELKVEKTSDETSENVKRQLRLIDTATDTPKFAYLTCAKWQNGREEDSLSNDTTPMGLFLKIGDTVEFGPWPSWFADRLNVCLQLVRSQGCVAIRPEPELPKTQLATEVLKWFEDDNFGDTTILAKNGLKLRCHRDFLSARSEVFRQMFNSRTNKAEKLVLNKEVGETSADISISIKDIAGEIVAQLLLFCYIDGCGEIGPIANRLCAAAHQYKLDRLKNLCESAMAASLCTKSVVKTYRLARVYHLDKLMAECVEYLEDNRDEINMAKLLVGSV